MLMAGAIVHVEIPVTDLEVAKRFYSDVFGWKIYERQGFTVFETTPRSVNGSLRITDEVPSEGISLYIQVENIESKLKNVIRKGGTVKSEIVKVPGVGWQASIVDVFGNKLYLYTPIK